MLLFMCVGGGDDELLVLLLTHRLIDCTAVVPDIVRGGIGWEGGEECCR
jgi:hypothetical protein